MSTDGQKLTKQVYEDPEVVEGFIQRNALSLKQIALIQEFASIVDGRKVLDLGCGPGHESYALAELGFKVVGLDYSEEMIRRAKKLRVIDNMPEFVVGDMRRLGEYFDEDSFDAIWASASLLHIRREEIETVVKGMTKIVKKGAKVFVSLKKGAGEVVVDEEKFGKKTQREFVLWQRDEFEMLVDKYGWKLERLRSREGSEFLGKSTEWMNFFFGVEK